VGEDEGGCHPPPTIYPLLIHIHIRARARSWTRVRTRTQSCGRSLLRTRGDNKICDNQPQRRRRRRESVMTLSRTSSQATSVTLRAHLPLSLVFFLFSPPSRPLFCAMPISISILISTSISIYISASLHPSPSSSLALYCVLYLCPCVARWLVQLTSLSSLSVLSQASCSHHYDVFRDRKLSLFHDRLLGTIRQQFVPTVKTRDYNGVLCRH